MKNTSRRLNPVLLKWTAVPLLTFLLAGLVTKKLVGSAGVSPTAKLLHAKREAEGKPFQQTVDDSLKRLDSGDRAGAAEGMGRAGKMAPDDSTRQVSSIPKFLALGEYKLAAQAIECFIRSEPDARQATRSYANLCEFLLEHNDLNNAKRILTSDLLARWPDALETDCVQGEVALKEATGSADVSLATKLFQKCLALEPDNVPAKLQLGIAYWRLGELDKAEPLLRAAVDKRPFDPVALYHLGEVLRKQGKTAEATRCFDEHKRVRDLQDRRKQLEGQYELQKYQPADLLELARIYGQLGELSRAASTLRVYNLLKPADADGQRELAQACLKLNDNEDARVATRAAYADTMRAK